MESELQRFLRETTVNAALRTDPRALVEADSNSSVQDTLHLMKKHSILSVPVYGRVGHWIGAGGNTSAVTADKQYIGIVSVVDILYYLYNAPEKEAALTKRVVDAIGASMEGRSLWVTRRDSSLAAAVEPLSKLVHRCLVPVEGLGFSLLTQTDVVRFIYTHVQRKADDVFGMTVGQCLSFIERAQQKPRILVTATSAHTVGNTLDYMHDQWTQAVPIVNASSGALEGTLSCSDFRGLDSTNIRPVCAMTVAEFLADKKQWQVGAPSNVSCLRSHTVGEVVGKLLLHHVHRAWVVDEFDRPEDLLSFTDILCAIRMSD
mmetsp:Transcript_6674/g.11685  ORF Transcript_6674/g.11685 Transcript_6674/m.11685 type:complete len:318 (+) Transcript_6674:42-995(+)